MRGDEIEEEAEIDIKIHLVSVRKVSREKRGPSRKRREDKKGEASPNLTNVRGQCKNEKGQDLTFQKDLSLYIAITRQSSKQRSQHHYSPFSLSRLSSPHSSALLVLLLQQTKAPIILCNESSSKPILRTMHAFYVEGFKPTENARDDAQINNAPSQTCKGEIWWYPIYTMTLHSLRSSLLLLFGP